MSDTSPPQAHTVALGHPRNAHVVELPCSCFYWCILEASGVSARGVNVPSSNASANLLNDMLEEHLPLPLEKIHVIYRRIDEHRVLACALPVEALEAVTSHTVILRPDSMPLFVSSVCDVRPSVLNMLVGPFESQPVKNERSKGHWLLAASLVAASVLTVIGLVRREHHWNETKRLTDIAFESVANRFQPDPPVRLTDVPVRVRAEISELRQIVESSDPAKTSPHDAAVVLGDVLAAWPKDAVARTDLISVSPTSVSMNVQVEGDAQSFIAGLTPPTGWSLDPPRLNVIRGSSHLAIQLRRVGAGISGGAQ